MIQNVFNINSIGNTGVDLSRVRQMLSSGTVSQNVNSFGADSISLASPVSMGPLPALGPVPAFGGSSKSPSQQILDLGKKYNIPFSGDMDSYQKRVIKAAIMHKAIQYGVPLPVALGIAGNESGWKMWSNIEKGTVVQGKNIKNGQLLSTDWGIMQINDKAHPKAFPQVKYDLEANIDYGLKFLSKRRDSISGSLGLGFGNWDRTIASYNLGHNPKTESGYQIATKYVSGVKKRSLQA